MAHAAPFLASMSAYEETQDISGASLSLYLRQVRSAARASRLLHRSCTGAHATIRTTHLDCCGHLNHRSSRLDKPKASVSDLSPPTLPALATPLFCSLRNSVHQYRQGHATTVLYPPSTQEKWKMPLEANHLKKLHGILANFKSISEKSGASAAYARSDQITSSGGSDMRRQTSCGCHANGEVSCTPRVRRFQFRTYSILGGFGIQALPKRVIKARATNLCRDVKGQDLAERNAWLQEPSCNTREACPISLSF